MAGPIGPNYSKVEIAELNTIWRNLPTADAATLKADVTKLTAIAKAHPNSDLNKIIKLIGPGMDNFEIMDVEYALSYDLYPQSPNILPKTMSDSLKSVIKSLESNPTPEQLNSDYSTLQNLLNQANALQPPSPQSVVIINNIEGAMGSVQGALQNGTPPGAFTEAISELKFLLNTSAAS